jgi:sodium/bile acid cotransporter 2
MAALAVAVRAAAAGGGASAESSGSGAGTLQPAPTPLWKLALTNALLALLFFGLAATVETSNFRSKFDEKRGIACGVCCQFFIVPFLGFVSTQLFDLQPVYGITLLVLCSSPGGSYSNWWCSIFNADLALSVAMTTCSTFLSVAMLPLNTMFYVHLAYGRANQPGPELNWGSLAFSLLLVNGSIGAGIGAGQRWPQHRARFNGVGQLAGISLMVISAVISSKKRPIWDREPSFYAATTLPCLGAVLCSTLIASAIALPKPEQVAVVIETCYQNIGIATAVALSTFPDEETAGLAAGVPVYYGVLEACVIAVICLVSWQLGWTYAPKDAGLLRVIGGNFQPAGRRGGGVGAGERDGVREGDVQLVEMGASAPSEPSRAPPPPADG